jgi:DNA adenine methylase
MQKPRSYSEVYNDRWDVVVNVFRVLRDPLKAKELERMIRLTPYSRTEFQSSYAESSEPCGDIEAARRTILRSFAGFGSASTNGDYATGFRANSNRSGTTPAHDWMHYPDSIKEYVERLRGVVIENREALDVIRQHDHADTLFYIDPPYPHDTRNMARGNAAYAIDMTDAEHRFLGQTLRSATGMILVSGYPCELYDQEIYFDWKRIERHALADGARKRIEVVWMNRSAVCAMNQPHLAGLREEKS